MGELTREQSILLFGVEGNFESAVSLSAEELKQICGGQSSYGGSTSGGAGAQDCSRDAALTCTGSYC